MKKKLTLSERICYAVILLVILPFLLYGAMLLFLPISRSNESVRRYVLRKIPIGTSYDEAIEIISSKGWEIKQTNTDYGLEYGLWINEDNSAAHFADIEDVEDYKSDPVISTTSPFLPTDTFRIVGKKVVYVKLGEFYGPLPTAVKAYIAFDENNELLEVIVLRDVDSI